MSISHCAAHGGTRVRARRVWVGIWGLMSVAAAGLFPAAQAAAAVVSIGGTPATSVAAAKYYNFQPSASDTQNKTLTFSIANKPAWAGFDPVYGRLYGSTVPANVGTYSNIVISVSDGVYSAALPPFSITVTPLADPGPVISGAPSTSAVVGKAYSFQPAASDSYGLSMSFEIYNKPAWMTLNSATGALSGTPSASDVGTYSQIIESVTDGYVTASLQAFNLTVAAAPVASSVGSVSISGTPVASVAAAKYYNFQPSASDTQNKTLTFSIANKPAWAGFDPVYGRLYGSTVPANVGTYSNIVISVSDGQYMAELPPFSITVTPLADPGPVISGAPSTSAVVGKPYSFTPTASDSYGLSMGFEISNKPAWMTLNTATGALSGTPSTSDVGTYPQIVESVTDGYVTASLQAFTLTVAAAPLANAAGSVSISGTPVTSVAAAKYYNFQPSASDSQNKTLTFSIANMPTWAAFDPVYGRLYGSTVPANVGTYSNIVISVSDGQYTAALPPFSVTVTPLADPGPVISGTPSGSAVVGTPYSFQPTASDSYGLSMGFEIYNKPAWMTLSTVTGALSGTPSASDVGTYPQIVESVTDGYVTASLQAFTLTVSGGSGSASSGSTSTPPTLASVTLQWLPPTENTDASPLTNLAGYHVYYGTNAQSLSSSVTVASPGISSYVVQNLAPGTWYFAVAAYNTDGVEGDLTPTISQVVP